MTAKLLRHSERRTDAAKCVEYGSDCLLNLLIRIQHDPTFIVVGESKRQEHLKFAALGFV